MKTSLGRAGTNVSSAVNPWKRERATTKRFREEKGPEDALPGRNANTNVARPRSKPHILNTPASYAAGGGLKRTFTCHRQQETLPSPPPFFLPHVPCLRENPSPPQAHPVTYNHGMGEQHADGVAERDAGKPHLARYAFCFAPPSFSCRAGLSPVSPSLTCGWFGRPASFLWLPRDKEGGVLEMLRHVVVGYGVGMMDVVLPEVAGGCVCDRSEVSSACCYLQTAGYLSLLSRSLGGRPPGPTGLGLLGFSLPTPYLLDRLDQLLFQHCLLSRCYLSSPRGQRSLLRFLERTHGKRESLGSSALRVGNGKVAARGG